MYLLLIDLLGVKARWARGSAEATAALQAFDEFVVAGLDAAGVVPTGGGIDSDATALVFDEIDDALAAARQIFLACFTSGDPLTDERYWMRGVIVASPTVDTRSSTPLPDPYASLTRSHYSSPLMEAVCVEASGRLKGMRLVVATELLTPDVWNRFAIKTNHGHLVPFRHLDMTQYPPGDWTDLLWMVPDDPDQWPEIDKVARTRMRASGLSLPELDHAAHTRVVFDQVGAMLMMQHFRGTGLIL